MKLRSNRLRRNREWGQGLAHGVRRSGAAAGLRAESEWLGLAYGIRT